MTRSCITLLATAVGISGTSVPGFATDAQGDTESPYSLRLEADDLSALRDGFGLNEADPDYCEKRRDLCLLAECGGLTRKNLNQACWAHCTERNFTKCEAEVRTP